jgi:hypothetical protein
MSLDTERISIGQNQVIWVKKQTVKGTPVMPTASDTVLVTSEPKFDQEPKQAENKEKKNTYAQQKKKRAGFKVGTFSTSSNIKPSGALGTAPNVGAILESLYGREVIDPGVDVQYKHYRPDEDSLVYLTILVKRDIETLLCQDCVVNKGSFKVVADLIQSGDFSGMFLKSMLAGSDELDSAIDGTVTPVTLIPLKYSAKRYEVGAYVVVGTDDNSGAGFEITARDIVASPNTITIAGGVTTVQAIGSIVKGWTPSISVSGDSVVGQFGYFKEDLSGSLANTDITEAIHEVDNGFKALENEKKDSDFPGQIAFGPRKVDLKTDRYFRVDGSDFRHHVNQLTDIEVELNVGNEQAKKMKWVIPVFQPQNKNESGTDEQELEIKGTCYEDSGNDESTLIFD